MGLSHDIISEFVRITNDKKEKPKEGIVYGVVAQTSDGNYVKIDGSDLITPAETTTEVQDGERVTVMIKDHTATITGNVTSPSANSNSINKKFESVSDKIGTFELIVADKISANELEVYKATIDVLIAGKATIQDLEVVNATIEHLYAQNATIENLVANKASIKDLDVVNATIENLKAKDAEIEHAVIDNLEATLADIKVLNADFAQIRTLVNGNLTSDNILSFNITSDKVTMEDAFIKDAMIANVSAAKINAGKINTNNVTIGSEDGGMLITGSTQQFVDKDGNVRIQIGRDAKGDFTFILYGEDGVGQLINQNGITASAISDGLIVNDMVSDKAAISGEKLDISSVITEINNDNSTTIKSNKIYLNKQEQSLEVAFNSLKSQVETIKDITVSGDLTSVIDRVQANTTEIEVNKERINTLILEDSIIKKQVTDLEGDVVETSTTLASKYSELDQTIEGFKTSVADTYATKSTVNDISNNLSTNYSTTSAMNSAINQKVDEINLSISETYATNETVNDINDNLLKNYSTTSVMNSTINQKVDEISLSVSETYATISSVDGINDKLSTEYPTIAQMDSAITQTATEISSTVAKQEIQNTKIGGTNLIGQTTETGVYGVEVEEVLETGWAVRGSDDDIRDNAIFRFLNVLDGNGWYTFSFDGMFNGSSFRTYVEVNDQRVGTVELTSEWQHFSFTFEVTNYDFDNTGVYTFIEFQRLGNKIYYFKNIQLEHGKIETDYSPCPSDYSTTTKMNSAIQQKADEITSTVNETKRVGVELLPQNYKVNSTIGYKMVKGELLVSPDSDGFLYSTVAQTQWRSEPIQIDRNSPVYYYFHFQNTGGYALRDVFGLEQLNHKKESVGNNYLTIELYNKTETGHVYVEGTVDASAFDSNTRFIQLRMLGNWDSATMGQFRVYKVSLKQLYSVDATSKITQNADQIASTINKLETNYSTTTEMNSAITQKATEISSTVAKQEVQNMQIGGRNLIKNTPNILLQDSDHGNLNTCSLVDGTNSVYVRIAPTVDGNVYGFLNPCEKLIKGEWYTISFEFWNDSGSPIGLYWYPSEHLGLSNYIPSVANTWQKVSFTYQQTGETRGGGNFNCLFGFHQLKAGVRYAYTNVQLERGKIPTSWSPSPSDYSTTTKMNSAIKQKADEITSTVNANYTTLNNKFNNYPTTTQMNSAIQQKADEITSSVNMTKIGGVELLPQGYRCGNSTSGYSVRTGGTLKCDKWGLYITKTSFVMSDYIAVDPNLPIAYEYEITNADGTPLTYLGVEQYTGTKEEVGTNAATIYFLQTSFRGTKKDHGTLTLDSNTRYIKLRWLSDWNSTGMSYCQLSSISLKQLGSINQSTKISQMSDSISSTVSSVNSLGSRMSTAESTITQHTNQIATKVDVNGVKSTIQQNPESVRIGFNSISNYFDLTSARLKVGHTDGSYTEIGQNGVMYYANGSGNRYHCLMKQGWLGQISGTSWSRTITLPSEFKGKTFSVIVSVTEVNAVNTHDVIKHFKVTVPHSTVNYTNGTFVINMSALAYYVPGQQSASAIQTDVSWIAIC